ncbi:MAG TPA: YciI family protein [Thermoanaerobaculia bacterium]|nr:YciI family protein [Thermoanaerobaculia bacterium]
MKFVMFYELAADGMSKVMEHYEAHGARLHEFHSRGVLLMAGPLGNPPEGALAIFTTREAAEEFVAGDPFVTNGVVAKSRVVEWQEALA